MNASIPIAWFVCAPWLLAATAAAAEAPSHDAAAIARGRYLIRIMGCNDCHTAGYAANGGKVEYQTSATSAYEPLFDGLPTIDDGWITLPQKPGFGFKPRREAIAEFAVK